MVGEPFLVCLKVPVPGGVLLLFNFRVLCLSDICFGFLKHPHPNLVNYQNKLNSCKILLL